MYTTWQTSKFTWQFSLKKISCIQVYTLLRDKLVYYTSNCLCFELMEKSLKVAWIKRFAENNHAAWKIIPKHTLSQHSGISFFTQCQYDMKFFDLRNLLDFYRTILNSWQNFKLLTDNDKAAQNQIIWNNSNILVDGKPILYNSWLINGIIYIKDLLDRLKFSLSGRSESKIQLRCTFYDLLKTIPANCKKSIQNTDVPHMRTHCLPDFHLQKQLIRPY